MALFSQYSWKENAQKVWGKISPLLEPDWLRQMCDSQYISQRQEGGYVMRTKSRMTGRLLSPIWREISVSLYLKPTVTSDR